MKLLPLEAFAVNSPWVVDFAPITHAPSFYIRTPKGWWCVYSS